MLIAISLESEDMRIKNLNISKLRLTAVFQDFFFTIVVEFVFTFSFFHA